MLNFKKHCNLSKDKIVDQLKNFKKMAKQYLVMQLLQKALLF